LFSIGRGAAWVTGRIISEGVCGMILSGCWSSWGGAWWWCYL